MVLFLVGLGALGVPVHAQSSRLPKPGTSPAPLPSPAPKTKPKEIPLAERLRSPHQADRPLVDKLRSPRETLKTLYFAVLFYDLFPEMIEDAVACLDLDAVQPRPATEDAAMLALDLEHVLQSLALPLSSVPDEEAGDAVLLHDGDGIKLALQRGQDGGWRFDAATLGRLPAMRRAAQQRLQSPPTGPRCARASPTTRHCGSSSPTPPMAISTRRLAPSISPP